MTKTYTPEQQEAIWGGTAASINYTAPETSAHPVDDDDWQFTRGLKAGIDQVQGLGYGALSLSGDAVGSVTLRDYGMEGYQRNMAEAEEHGGRIKSWSEIQPFTDAENISDVGTSINDIADYVLYGGGTLVPTMAAALAGGGIGGVLGKAALKKSVTGMLSGTVAKQATKLAAAQNLTKAAAEKAVVASLATTIGSTAGLVGATTTMESGGIFGEIYEETGEYVWDKALVGGLAAGALDALPAGRVLNTLGFGKIAKEGVADVITKSDVLKEGLTQALFEGSTEVGQTIIEKATIKWVDDNYEVFSDENIVEIIDSFLLGGIGGGAMGVGSASIRGILERDVAALRDDNLPGGGYVDENGVVFTPVPDSQISPEEAGENAAADVEAQGGDALAQQTARTEATGAAEFDTPPVAPHKTRKEALKEAWEQVVAGAAEKDAEVASKRQAETDARESLWGEELERIESLTEDQKDAEIRAEFAKREGLAEKEEKLNPKNKSVGHALSDALADKARSDKKSAAAATTTAPVIENEVDAAAHEGQESPLNDSDLATPGQIDAGNYKKGHTKVQDLDVTIENPEGSVRSGVDSDGKEWSVTMPHHYGYIKRSLDNTGENIDVFVGKNHDSDQVFIVNQVDQKTGDFDEPKVMLSFGNKMQAAKAYKDSFGPGHKVGDIQQMSVTEFKDWVKNTTAESKADIQTESQELTSEAEFQEIVESRARKSGKASTVRWSKSGKVIPFGDTNATQQDNLRLELGKVSIDLREPTNFIFQVANSAETETVIEGSKVGSPRYDKAALTRIYQRRLLQTGKGLREPMFTKDAAPTLVKFLSDYAESVKLQDVLTAQKRELEGQIRSTRTRGAKLKREAHDKGVFFKKKAATKKATQKKKAEAKKQRAEKVESDKAAAVEGHHKDVSSAVARLVKVFPGLKTKVIRDITEAPADVLAAAKASPSWDLIDNGTDVAEGFYHEDSNTAYLISSALTNEKHVVATFLHEVIAHGGLRGLLQGDFNTVLDEIFNSKISQERVNELAVEIFGESNATTQLASSEGKRIIADEYIAELAADSGINPGVMKTLVATIRRILRGYGVDVNWTDSDIKALLSRSAQNLQRRPLHTITLTDDMTIQGSDEKVKIEQPADVALRRLDKRLGVLQTLKGCVSG